MVQNQRHDSKRESVCISIVLPVYNAEPHIKTCLDSITDQSLKNIEIICVNDGSSDESLKILNEYLAKDDRFIVYSQKNSGPGVARNKGISLATGEYIAFMDPDDWYPDNNVLESLYDTAKKNNAKICGGSLVYYNQNLDILDYDRVPDAKFSKSLFISFKDYQYDYFFQRFIYSRNLLNKYAIDFPDLRRYQDVIFFLNAMLKAKKFYAVPDVCYVYRANHHPAEFFSDTKILDWTEGIIRSLKISRDNKLSKLHYNTALRFTYDNFLNASESLRWSNDSRYENKCKDLLDSVDVNLLRRENGDIDENYPYYVLFTGQYIHDIMNKSESERARLTTEFINTFGKRDFVKTLVANYLTKWDLVSPKLSIPPLKKINREVRTIGIFNQSLEIGGVERCISLQIPIFQEMGYEVVLFTESEPRDDAFYINSDVKRVVLPGLDQKDVGGWLRRCDVFPENIIKEKVDVIYYHSYWKGNIIWDTLICKLLGEVPFVIHHHNVFSAMLARRNKLFNYAIDLYRYCDCMITLSRVDKMYFDSMGIKSFYIYNPITPDENVYPTCNESEKENIIVWAGRLVPNHKQPIESLKVINEVSKKIPDAKLLILGDGEESVREELTSYVYENNLEDNVSFLGFVSDMGKYYSHAKVYLLTSVIEGFPMVISECKSHSLPIVAYDLPYVEMIREANSGVIRVEQGDYVAAADHVVRLMEDDKYRINEGNNAKKSLKNYSTEDMIEKWEKVFDYLKKDAPDKSGIQDFDTESYKILLKTFKYHSYLSNISWGSDLSRIGGRSLSSATVYKNWEKLDAESPTYISLALSAGLGSKIQYHLERMSLKTENEIHLFEKMGNFTLNDFFICLTEGTDSYFINMVEEDGDIPKRKRVRDVDHGIVSLHEFPSDRPIYEYRDEMMSLYNDRVLYLNRKILSSKSVLFVTQRRSTDAELIDFGFKLSEIYRDTKIYLDLVESQTELTVILFRTVFKNKTLHIRRIRFNDSAEDNMHERWKGNTSNWVRYLSTYERND